MKIKHLFLLILSFVFVTFIIYREIFSYYFFSDDFIWLLHAKNDTLNQIPSYFYDSQGFFYRPFTKIYFWIMWHSLGLQPFWYHMISFLLHALVSLLVYVFGIKLFTSFSRRLGEGAVSFFSAMAAFIFFVHPVHAEMFIWPSAITELFPAFFLLLGLILFINSISSLRKLFYYIPICLLFILGLFSHEYAVIFPVLILSVDLFLSEKQRISELLQHIQSKIWFYVVLIIIDISYLVLRFVSGSHWSGGDYSYDLAKLPFNVIGNLMGYLGISFVGLPFIDVYSSLRTYARTQISISVVVILLVIFALYQLGMFVYRKYSTRLLSSYVLRVLIFSTTFFIIALAPFLGLGGIAERYVYFASIIFILVFCFLAYRISVFVCDYTEAVSIFSSFMIITMLPALLFTTYSLYGLADWNYASDYVSGSMAEFRKDKCADIPDGSTISRRSPPNRVGRAWIYQVGYEEAASLVCNKNIKINRIQ